VVEESTVDKAIRIAAAAEALAAFQQCCGTVEEHAIADLICDLGHLAEERDRDFIAEVRRGIGHWFAEHHAHDSDHLGPDATVEITINSR
jgi:hypothetical protein